MLKKKKDISNTVFANQNLTYALILWIPGWSYTSNVSKPSTSHQTTHLFSEASSKKGVTKNEQQKVLQKERKTKAIDKSEKKDAKKQSKLEKETECWCKGLRNDGINCFANLSRNNLMCFDFRMYIGSLFLFVLPRQRTFFL